MERSLQRIALYPTRNIFRLGDSSRENRESPPIASLWALRWRVSTVAIIAPARIGI